MEKTIRRSIVSGRLQAPPSAAIAHRAILAASFSPGQSVISHIPFTTDVNSTISACEALGADIAVDPEGGTVDIFGMQDEFEGGVIDCGQSNTTFKLFLPLLPALGPKSSITGSGALAKKPLEPYMVYLERLGARVSFVAGALPIELEGPLVENEIVCFPQFGTQFFSGLLFSSAVREEQVSIGLQGEFENPQYAAMTVDLLSEFGVAIQRSDGDFFFDGNQDFSSANFEAPASSYLSSFILLAGAAAGKVMLSGLGKEDSEALAGLFRSFDASASSTDETLTISAGFPHKAEFDARELGLYLPHALVLALLSQGECRFSNIASLGMREDRRMKLMLRELSKMGLKSEERGNELTVSGGKLTAAAIRPEGDAAVAMACSVAGLCASGQTQITETECVEKAYPGFFQELERLGAIIH